MAPFNPQIQDINPESYLRLSKPITQPEADKSTGIALAGAADVLGEGVKAADFVTKSNIQDEVHSAVEAERDKYTQSLRNAESAVRGAAAGTPVNSLVGDTPKVPSALQNLPSSLSALDGAKATGKLSETGYLARLDVLAKDFRSRYPGYRDYVDSQVEKITGVNPANAVIKSLVSDINSFITQQKDDAEKIDNFARSHLNIPGLYEKYAAYKAGTGTTPMDIYQHAAEWETIDSKLKRNALLLNDYKGDRERQGIFAKTAVSEQNAELARQDLSNFTVTTPTGPMNISDYFNKVSSGELPAPTSTQAQLIAQDLSAKRAILAKGMYDYAHQAIPGMAGESVASLAGEDHLKTSINTSLEGHNMFEKMLLDEKYGYAHATANLSKARSSEFMKALEESPGGQYIQTMRAFSNVSKDFGDVMLKAVVTSSMTPADKDSITYAASKIIGQPNLRAPAVSRGIDFIDPTKVFTLDKAMSAAANADDPGKARSAILNIPTKLSDPTLPDEAKVNVAVSTFSGNTLQNTIHSIPMDTVDKGREIPGKFAAFNTIASKENSEEMYRLGKKDPPLWDNYKGKVEDTFANELALPSVRELNAIQIGKNVGVAWDSDKLEFHLEVNGRVKRSRYDAGDPSGFFSAAEGEQAARMVNRLNAGISNVVHVQELDGQDKAAQNAYVLRLLMGLGLNADKMSIPNLMIKQVIEANRKQEKQ